MAMEAYPSISETTFGLTFFESRIVAQEWRRLWKRICGSPLEKGLEAVRGDEAAVQCGSGWINSNSS